MLRPSLVLASLTLLLSAACSSGRCVDEISIKPNASRIGGVVAASADLSFRFGDCLTENELEAAERIKMAVAQAFERFSRGEMSEQQYNSHVDAARRALEQVIYVLTPAQGGGRSPRREVQRPRTFEDIRNVCKSIERELGTSD